MSDSTIKAEPPAEADASEDVKCIEIKPEVADADTSAAPDISGENADPPCDFGGVNIDQKSPCKRKLDSSSQSDEVSDVDKEKRRRIRCEFGASSSSEEAKCPIEEENAKKAPLSFIQMIFPDREERKFMLKVVEHILKPVQPVPKPRMDGFLWSALRLCSTHEKLFENIINSVRLNEILKSPLSPNPLNCSLEPVELPCTRKANAWKNNVNHPAVCAKDADIKRIVDSALVDQNRCKKELNDVLTDLNEVVKIKGCTNTWHWFGSYLTGVVTPGDDIQLHFECTPDKSNIVTDGNALCHKVVSHLNANPRPQPLQFYKLECHTDIPSPWILAGHRPTGKDIVIVFSNDFSSGEMSVAKSLLMKLYLDTSPTLKYLFVFVDMIFKNSILDEFYAWNKSYLIFWLVVFFMQHEKLLPPVIDIRKAAETKYYVDGWDCSLPESYSYPTPEPAVSLYALLVQFFDFYEKFDFLNCLICPYLGRVFRLSDFERLQIPTEEFALYLRHQNDPSRLTFVRNIINLQDPSDLCCNVAELLSTNGIRILNAIKFLCHRLIQLLPSSIEEMEKMHCLFKTPQDNFDRIRIFAPYAPYNLTQYTLIFLQADKIFLKSDTGHTSRQNKLNQMYIIEAIRKIMESIFSFEKKSIVISQNITQRFVNKKSPDGKSIVESTFPVIYFEYCASKSTRKNEFMKKILFRKVDKSNQTKIFLTCEVCLDVEWATPFIKIYIQGDSRFVTILKKHYRELFRLTFNEIITV